MLDLSSHDVHYEYLRFQPFRLTTMYYPAVIVLDDVFSYISISCVAFIFIIPHSYLYSLASSMASHTSHTL